MHEDLQLRPTKKISELVQRYSEGVSLDAGCGTEVCFDHFNGNIVGFDITEILLRRANQRIKEGKGKSFYPILGTVTRLPFRDKVFDYVLCS